MQYWVLGSSTCFYNPGHIEGINWKKLEQISRYLGHSCISIYLKKPRLILWPKNSDIFWQISPKHTFVCDFEQFHVFKGDSESSSNIYTHSLSHIFAFVKHLLFITFLRLSLLSSQNHLNLHHFLDNTEIRKIICATLSFITFDPNKTIHLLFS